MFHKIPPNKDDSEFYHSQILDNRALCENIFFAERSVIFLGVIHTSTIEK